MNTLPTPESRERSRGAMRLARAAFALATGALLAAAASGLGHRAGLWGYPAGFAILGVAALCALTGMVFGLICLARGAGASRLARRLSLAACVVGLVVTGVPARQLYLAKSLPRIHDISTDTADPPAFVAVVPLRVDAPNPAAYPGEATAGLQRAAYPRIAPHSYLAGRQAVFDAALAIVRQRGWTVHAAQAGEGRIEASATSLWFGFMDDVSIRVADSGKDTRVDMRSKSRVGLSDLGVNAKRIESFMADLDEALAVAR